jgi:hypothetical protein
MTITHALPGTYFPNWLTKYARSPTSHGTSTPWLWRSVTQKLPQRVWAARYSKAAGTR